MFLRPRFLGIRYIKVGFIIKAVRRYMYKVAKHCVRKLLAKYSGGMENVRIIRMFGYSEIRKNETNYDVRRAFKRERRLFREEYST